MIDDDNDVDISDGNDDDGDDDVVGQIVLYIDSSIRDKTCQGGDRYLLSR